ncbi:MAG TPA: hypothetical protein DIT04_11030 [Dysgonomonas sp.]|nr:hypothetical protein [Dysgonomonas sp.]
MKRILLYITLSVLVFPVMNSQNTERQIRFDQPVVRTIDSNTIINFNIILDNLDMRTVEMITLTPVIRSNESQMSRDFTAVVIVGGNREKMLKRSINFNMFQFEKEPRMIIEHPKNKKQSIPVELSIPYNEDLRNAELYIDQKINGCACSDEGTSRLLVQSPLLPPVYNPVFNICYITPPVEEVKMRSEKYTAYLNFKVGKYDLLYDFGNNARILKEVDEIISSIKNDANLRITEFQITGYASPEGNYDSNMKLSENRAYAFFNYLEEKYGIDRSILKTDWKGEDWDGLRKIVDSSYIENKNEIISIIDNEYDIATRKNKLRNLAGGSTYRNLLNQYYPSLRRNEYTISYVARPFSVDEAKTTIRTKPQYLSQNEMFLVANTYPKNSREFKETFDIIARYYPDNNIVKANMAAIELEYNNWDEAIRQLEAINDNSAEKWNNLGYAYFQKGDYTKARDYFNRAYQMGLDCAANNIAELQKWENTFSE